MKNFIQSLKTLLIAVVLFFGVAIVSAQVSVWNPPSQNPPNGNTPAPLNVGTLDQVKSAGLSLNRLLVNGQVQINDGTAAVGKVLTSLDAQGTAQWAVAGAGGGGSLEYKVGSNPEQCSLVNTTYGGTVLRCTPVSGTVVATCSVGRTVINGGCEFHSFQDNTSYGSATPYSTRTDNNSPISLISSAPLSTGGGWRCVAQRDFGIYHLLSITATAICQ